MQRKTRDERGRRDGGEYRVICELKLDVQKTSDRDPSLGYSAKRSVLAREVEGSERSGNQPNFS